MLSPSQGAGGEAQTAGAGEEGRLYSSSLGFSAPVRSFLCVDFEALFSHLSTVLGGREQDGGGKQMSFLHPPAQLAVGPFRSV